MNHPSLSELYQLRNKLQNEIISLKIKNRAISQRFKSNKELNLGEMVQYYYEQCINSRDIMKNRYSNGNENTKQYLDKIKATEN